MAKLSEIARFFFDDTDGHEKSIEQILDAALTAEPNDSNRCRMDTLVNQKKISYRQLQALYCIQELVPIQVRSQYLSKFTNCKKDKDYCSLIKEMAANLSAPEGFNLGSFLPFGQRLRPFRQYPWQHYLNDDFTELMALLSRLGQRFGTISPAHLEAVAGAYFDDIALIARKNPHTISSFTVKTYKTIVKKQIGLLIDLNAQNYQGKRVEYCALEQKLAQHFNYKMLPLLGIVAASALATVIFSLLIASNGGAVLAVAAVVSLAFFVFTLREFNKENNKHQVEQTAIHGLQQQKWGLFTRVLAEVEPTLPPETLAGSLSTL